jgi:hypothetical protein
VKHLSRAIAVVGITAGVVVLAMHAPRELCLLGAFALMAFAARG